MLLAGLMFAFMDAGMKWIASSYSPFQVATLRGLAALPPVLLWILLRGRTRTLFHVHWHLHLLRGVLGVGVMAGFVYGVARMPLSTAYAIVFVAPLMVTALAVPLLGEKVGPRRWAAIVVGLLGVLVVGFIVVLAGSTGVRATLDAAIVIALIGFVATVAYATYVERGHPE